MTREDLDKQRLELFRNMENAGSLVAEFVNTELSIGFSFVQGSSEYQSKGDPTEAARLVTLAEEALSQARKFLPLARFSAQDRNIVEKRIVQLDKLVTQSIESVSS